MIVAAGAVIGAALYFAAPLIARLMGAEGELARLAVEYLRVYAVCSPLTTIIFAVDNYLRVCGYVRGSMALNIFMSAISCALEFLFLASSASGYGGASLATCLGMMVSAAIAFAPFFLGRAQLRFRRPRFSFAMTRRIVAAGAPNFLNNIAGRVTSIMMNMLLIRLGGADAVSVYGILMTIEYLVLALCYGLCDGLQPAVGYNWGAGRYGRVKAIEKYCFASSAAVSFTSAAVIFTFPAQIASLFISDASPAFIEMAVYAMRLFSATYLLRWFSFASQSYMLAVERPAERRRSLFRRPSYSDAADIPAASARTYRAVAQFRGHGSARGAALARSPAPLQKRAARHSADKTAEKSREAVKKQKFTGRPQLRASPFRT